MELQFMMKIESSLPKNACVRLFPNNLKKIIHDWETVCCHINKNINFKNHTKSGEGKFLGLDDDGSVKIIVNEKIERFSDLQII